MPPSHCWPQDNHTCIADGAMLDPQTSEAPVGVVCHVEGLKTQFLQHPPKNELCGTGRNMRQNDGNNTKKIRKAHHVKVW